MTTTLPMANDADSKRDGHRLIEIMLTKDEWELLGNLCNILQGFAEATNYLGASKYVTHSVVNPLLKEIKKHIKPGNTRSNIDIEEITDVFEEQDEGEQAECGGKLNLNEPFITTRMLEKVKLNLYNAMETYWHEEEGKDLISALLDPRIKSLAFIDNEEIRNEAKELLNKKYHELKADSLLTTDHQTTSFLIPSDLPSPFNTSFTQPSLFLIFE